VLVLFGFLKKKTNIVLDYYIKTFRNIKIVLSLDITTVLILLIYRFTWGSESPGVSESLFAKNMLEIQLPKRIYILIWLGI